jgi:Asp-tRNA(Asn)/Glu-tRNA(Gln) amidotransferase C subunit
LTSRSKKLFSARGLEEKEAEELRETLSAISKFLDDIKKSMTDLISVILNAMRGDKVGEEVATSYKKLEERGLLDNVVRDIVKKCLEERVKMACFLDKLIGAMGKPRELHSQGFGALIEE